ncbi:MAG TPA: PQQ-binding-like beta-propeller repeat protein, partial [Candidatus Solibacter sp.]|nr:PQQ-binding-like beta-propeller repeat protein [Candidatus Solibacter sp.]
RGLGVSGPIVWNDRVFVTYQLGANAMRPGVHPTLVQGAAAATSGEHPLGGARPQGGAASKITLAVAAFDRKDGHQLWEYSFDADGDLPQTHEKRNLATPSPVTDGEMVYAWFSSGQLAALDMKGKLVWSRHLGREYSVMDINWGQSSSPALYKDQLILPCYNPSASFLLALDKKTGKQIWRADREKGLISYSTPLIVETRQGAEIVLNTSERVEAFDPSNGKLKWQFPEQNRFPIPMPVVDSGIVYLNRGYRSSPFMAIRAGGEGDITQTQVVWRVANGGPYVPSLVFYDGLLYMANEMGIVTAADAKSGEVVWRERLGGFYSASPVGADGKVYLLSETGEMLVLRAGRKAEVVAKNDLGEQCIASPAFSDHQIFIRTDRTLYAIGKGR